MSVELVDSQRDSLIRCTRAILRQRAASSRGMNTGVLEPGPQNPHQPCRGRCSTILRLKLQPTATDPVIHGRQLSGLCILVMVHCSSCFIYCFSAVGGSRAALRSHSVSNPFHLCAITPTHWLFSVNQCLHFSIISPKFRLKILLLDLIYSLSSAYDLARCFVVESPFKNISC